METRVNAEPDNSNKMMNWMITLISLVAGIVLLLFVPEMFWLALPFFLTYFVKAIDMM
jgi:hypothetical protein